MPRWWPPRAWAQALRDRVASARPAQPHDANVLHDAAREGRLRRVIALLNAGHDPNARDHHQVTPLVEASTMKVARVLLDAGAEVDPQPPAHTTPLGRAVQQGDADWVTLLLERGADPNACDNAGRSPLGRAHTDAMVARLLAAGTNPSLGSPMYWPAHRGDVVALARLLAAGADINAAINGKTPLIAAANSRLSGDALAWLLDHGADPNRVDTLGQNALIVAAGRNASAAVARLVEAGSEVNAITERGINALHMSALGGSGREGSPDVLRTLLSAGAAGVNAQDMWGRTPLFIAVESAGAEDVAILLDAGGDPRVPDHEGRRMLDVAQAREDRRIAAMIEHALAINDGSAQSC